MINFSIKIQIGTTLYNYYIENIKDIKFEEKDHENIIERRRFFVGKLKISRTLNPEIWDKINLEEFWNENYVNFYISENSNVRLHYRGKFKYSEFNIDYDNCTFNIVNMINSDKYNHLLSKRDDIFQRYNLFNLPQDSIKGYRRSNIIAAAMDVNEEPSSVDGYTKIYENSAFKIWASEQINVLPDGHISNSYAAFQTKMGNQSLTVLDWIKTWDGKKWFRPLYTGGIYGGNLLYANSQLNNYYVYEQREQVTISGSEIWLNLNDPQFDDVKYTCTSKGIALRRLMSDLLFDVRIKLDAWAFYDTANALIKTLFISSVELVNQFGSGYESDPNYEKFEASLTQMLKIIHQLGYYYYLKPIDETFYDYEFIVKKYKDWYPITQTGLDLTNTGFAQPNKFSFDEEGVVSKISFNFKEGKDKFAKNTAIFFDNEENKKNVEFDFITDIELVHKEDERNLDIVIFAVKDYDVTLHNFLISDHYTAINDLLSTFRIISSWYYQNREYLIDIYFIEGAGASASTAGYTKKIKKAATIKVPMCIGDIIDKKVATTKLGTGEITKVTQTINDNMYAIEINY